MSTQGIPLDMGWPLMLMERFRRVSRATMYIIGALTSYAILLQIDAVHYAMDTISTNRESPSIRNCRIDTTII